MADSIDFTTTELFRKGIPKPRAYRQSAAVGQPKVRKPAEFIAHLVKHYRDGKNPNVFNYARLKTGEIRLLSLQPGREQDPINIVMFTAKLKDSIDTYEALSYSWGKVPKVHHSIFIDDKNPPSYTSKTNKVHTYTSKQTNLVQDVSRSLHSQYKIKRNKRWKQLLEKEAESSDQKKLAEGRRMHLEEIDSLLEQRKQFVQISADDEASQSQRKKLAAKFNKLDEEYANQYPIELEGLGIHQRRIQERVAEIRNPTEAPTPFQRFYVRPNLYAALTNLRNASLPVNLWVDAICINQQPNGLKEKDEQLSQMAAIYGNAINVTVWLGESDMRSKAALTLIERMLDFTQLDALLDKLDLNPQSNPDVSRTGQGGGDSRRPNGNDRPDNSNGVCEISSAHWFDLLELLRRPWFSRRWIIQEIGMAKNATVHIGDKHIHWDNLADAITLLNDKADVLRSKSRFNDAFDDIEGLSASFLVKVISHACRRSPDGSVAVKLMTLETLVCSLLAFDSYFPRDAIYSVLSLAVDWPPDNDDSPEFEIRLTSAEVLEISSSLLSADQS